jgi:chloramphenicol 3-O phosphotransferase
LNAFERQSLQSEGHIIVLNGASSAGKSSLALRLQADLSNPYLHVQLDSFRAMEPPDYFGPSQSEQSRRRLAALCRAMNATSIEYVRHGQNVILDHVLPPVGWRYLAEDLAPFSVFLVGVHCSSTVLETRERARQDRPIGLAASQVLGIHEGCEYDFNIDTTEATPDECALALREWLASSPRPRSFPQVVRKHAAV